MPYEEAVVGPSVEVEIRQYALSRETFDFIRAVLAQSATGAGTPFAVPPASIRGNVSNITNPSRRALGQFFAAEVAVARALGPDALSAVSRGNEDFGLPGKSHRDTSRHEQLMARSDAKPRRILLWNSRRFPCRHFIGPRTTIQRSEVVIRNGTRYDAV